MEWAYGVTTVPSRFDTTLPGTLQSLAAAGFDKPWLFVDGCFEHGLPEWVPAFGNTCRMPAVRTFGNWVLAAWELYIRNPRADRYAIFQDDLIACKNLRKYLELCPYPDHGYLNLYLFPCNHLDQFGWYPANQQGKGAVGLVFDRPALQELLASEHMVLRPPDRTLRPVGGDWTKGQANIDGAVVTALRKAGWREFVHYPSLLQHTGDASTMGNFQWEKASSFNESYDPLLGFPNSAEIPREPRRIGLVGWNSEEEVGQFNWELTSHISINRWLVKPHPVFKTREPHPDTDTVVCLKGQVDKMEGFIKAVDVVVFYGDPPYTELVEMCARFKRRIVCIVQSWGTNWLQKPWTQKVNLFICMDVNEYRSMALKLPCAHVPRPRPDTWKHLAHEFESLALMGHQVITILPKEKT